jgi:hypothetical protein
MGDNDGTLSVEDVPGRARPACSRCSAKGSRLALCSQLLNGPSRSFLTIVPTEESSDELQNLKFLGIGPIEDEKVEQMVRHDVPA